MKPGFPMSFLLPQAKKGRSSRSALLEKGKDTLALLRFRPLIKASCSVQSAGAVPAAAAGVREVLLQGRPSLSLKPWARSRRACGKGSCGGCGRQGRHGDDDPSSRKHENSSQGLFSNSAADAAQCQAPALSSNPWFTSLSSSASSSWRGPSSDSSSSS